MRPMPAASLYRILAQRGVSFYVGVPDSLLKDFLAYVMSHTSERRHVIAANEGAAVAIAAGHYLAMGKASSGVHAELGVGKRSESARVAGRS